MGAKAVVVFDPTGQPLANVEATFVQLGAQGNGVVFPLTNNDGYALRDFLPATSGYLKIIANGFKSYLQLVTLDSQNQTIRINNPGHEPNDILLPSLSFDSPSRDRIINVMANLCNLLDAQDCVIFEPFINYLILNDKNRANDWIARLKGAGSTHITTNLTGDYDEYLPWANGRYPIPGGDYTNNLGDFRRILDYLLNAGLIPIIKSGADGQNYQSVGMTYGWKWGMTYLPVIYDQLRNYWDYCLWSTGYDGCFPDWSPEQLLEFLRMMRDVFGEKGCIDTEFGAGPGESISYCHLGQGAANWVPDQLGMLDSFSIELQTYPAQDDGMLQVYQRLLDPTHPAYYRHAVTKTQNIGMYETTAYWSMRKYVSVTENRQVSSQAAKIGYKSFGNGLPL